MNKSILIACKNNHFNSLSWCLLLSFLSYAKLEYANAMSRFRQIENDECVSYLCGKSQKSDTFACIRSHAVSDGCKCLIIISLFF